MINKQLSDTEASYSLSMNDNGKSAAKSELIDMAEILNQVRQASIYSSTYVARYSLVIVDELGG